MDHHFATWELELLDDLPNETDREARNRIASLCAELHSKNDDLAAQLALAAPLITAALEYDNADAFNDDPEETGPRSQDGLRLAREVFTAAVQNYIVGLTAPSFES